MLAINETIENGENAVDWSLARCRNIGAAAATVELFFSEQLVDIARAKAICEDCPVRKACLAGALERREPWGVWGGHLFSNGKVLAQKRKRGRPPKNAVQCDVEAQIA